MGGNKTMKRIISLILSITILMGISINFVSAETQSVYSEGEKFGIALGLVDEETYEPNTKVSRAEFAEIIARICMLKEETDNVDDWYNRIFGADNKYTPAAEEGERVFDDVDQSLPQYEAINIVYAHGFMRGLTETHFAPNYDITFGAVAKVLVSMLGYSVVAERNGGYPDGYVSVAAGLGITKNVGASTNGFITFKQCLEMLYNSLDVNMMDLSYMTPDGEASSAVTNISFLNGGLDLNKMEAKVEDNGFSSLYGETKINDGLIKIGGITMAMGNCAYARSYLGKNVEAYYKEIDGSYVLLYAKPVRNDELTFKAKDFISYNNGEIEYIDENGKIKSCDVSTRAKVIYNNKALTTYSSSIFNFKYGDITLVSTGNNKVCDLIVIRDYAVGKVLKVNAELEAIYTDTIYSSMTGVKTVNLEDNNTKDVMIYDQNGQSITIDKIKAGDIVSVYKSKDGNCTEVWVSDMTISDFVVTDYYIESDVMTISDGESTYRILCESDLINTLSIKLNEAYNLGFDFDGNLVWIEPVDATLDSAKGFVRDVEIKYGTWDNEYAVKMYTAKGEMEIFKIGEKVSFNNKVRKTKDIISELNAMANAEEVILYKSETNGKEQVLTSIVRPLPYGVVDTENRGWYHITPDVDLSTNENPNAQGGLSTDWNNYVKKWKMYYNVNGGTLNRAIWWSASKATAFCVPRYEIDYENMDKYSAKSPSWDTTTEILLDAYSSKQNDMTPESIAWSTKDRLRTTTNNQTMFLIESVSTSINEEFEDITILRGYTSNYSTNKIEPKTVYVTDEVEFCSDKPDNAPLDPTNYNIALVGPAKRTDLKPGDIITYNATEKDYLTRIKVRYDESLGNAFHFGTATKDGHGGDVSVGGHTAAGYPIYKNGNYVRLTKDLPHTVDFADPEVMANSSLVMTEKTNNNTIFVVEKVANGKISIRTGSMDDIVTYEESGQLAHYNKVVVVSYNGAMTVGTVIYK